jgi:hypothetical protein
MLKKERYRFLSLSLSFHIKRYMNNENVTKREKREREWLRGSQDSKRGKHLCASRTFALKVNSSFPLNYPVPIVLLSSRRTKRSLSWSLRSRDYRRSRRMTTQSCYSHLRSREFTRERQTLHPVIHTFSQTVLSLSLASDKRVFERVTRQNEDHRFL